MWLPLVGMTGFEPATTRPPDVYSTGLSYIPFTRRSPFRAKAGLSLNYQPWRRRVPCFHPTLTKGVPFRAKPAFALNGLWRVKWVIQDSNL